MFARFVAIGLSVDSGEHSSPLRLVYYTYIFFLRKCHGATKGERYCKVLFEGFDTSLPLEGKVATKLTDEVSVLRDCLNWRYCNSAPHPPHFIRHLLPREKALFKKFNAFHRRGELCSPDLLQLGCR